jgi:hypothetical protein
VLACATSWEEPNPETLESLRAELRGLGAALLIVSKDWLSFFQPPDDLATIGATLDAGVTIEQLLERHGISTRALHSDEVTLALLDGEGTQRYRTTVSGPAAAAESLLNALKVAGAEVSRARQWRLSTQISRREVVVLSLLSALTLVSAAGGKPDLPPAPAQASPNHAARGVSLLASSLSPSSKRGK